MNSERTRRVAATLLAVLVTVASFSGAVTAASDTTNPTADATVDDATLFLGSWAAFDASGSSDDVGVTSYSWDFGDGTSGTGVAPNHTYTSPGEYTATVTVSDGAGNTDSATVTVSVADAHPGYHGGPANLGSYPNQQAVTTKPEEAWNLTDGTPSVMQPTVVNGTLYVAFHDGGKFYALDPETGAEIWNATPGGGSGSTWTTPAYANDVLYIGSNDYKLHAIDAGTGAELWNYSTVTNVRSAPAVVDGVVYFGSNDGNMTAVNATTGEEIWQYTEYQPLLVESNPAVVDGVVYFGSNTRNVTALDAATGTKLWNFETIDEVQSDPTVVGDTVYVGSDSQSGQTSGDGQVYALNATDGTKRWNYTMAGDVDGGQAYADGVVYAGSRGGDFVALDADTGTEVWNVSGAGFRGAPVVAGGVVYVSDFDNGSVHAFDAATGDEYWAYASPTSNLYPTPLVWNNYVYYGSASHFYALTSPFVTDFTVTNPSGQNVTVAVGTAERLSSVSVSLSGAASASLTLSDFTETTNEGTYTYTHTYEGSTDGDYTATLDSAAGANGGSDSGSTDTVTVDTTPPTVSQFDATTPGQRDVNVSFVSDEQLTTVAVSISGAETGSLSTGEFTETDNGDGTYTYNATHVGSTDGSYTATLDTAADSAGNDGASGQTASVGVGQAVVSSSLEYVSGSKPDMNNLGLDASFAAGLLQVQVKNDTASVFDFSTEEDYELAGHGADDTTVLRINLTVSGFVPRALIGSARDTSWTRTNNSDGTWNISIAGSPAAVESYFASDGSTPSNWDGTVRANESQEAAMTFAVDDLGVMSQTYRERLNGSVMTTDAQEFGAPRYNTTGPNDKVELLVSAPHFAKDGSVNDGFFEAYLPAALLSNWGVTAANLTGQFEGSDRASTVQATNDGGARVEFDLHYSEGDAAITVDETAPTVSNYAVSNPSGRDVTVTLTATERLGTVRASVSGAETATLTTADFTESGTGPFTYTATYGGGTDGDFTVTLDVAADAAGNDGAAGESDTVSVSTSTGDGGGSDGGDGGSDDSDDSDDSGDNDDNDDNDDSSRSSDDGDDATEEETSIEISDAPDADGTADGDDDGPTADGAATDDDDSENGADADASGTTVVDRRHVKVSNLKANERVSINLSVSSGGDGGSDADAPGETGENGTTTGDADQNETATEEPVNILSEGLDLTLNRDGDATLDIEVRQVELEDTGATDDGTDTVGSDDDGDAGQSSNYELDELSDGHREFVAQTGSRPLGSIEVRHDFSDAEVSAVTHRFSVRKSYLERTGTNVEDVRLWRDEDTGWRELNTTLVGETETSYRFAAESPGLSVFTIGVRSAAFEVADVSLVDATETLAVGDEVFVEATVTNVGDTGGDYAGTLAIAEAQARESIPLGAGETTRIRLAVTLTDDHVGTQTVRLGDRNLGEISVSAAAAETPEQVTERRSVGASTPTPADEDAGGWDALWVVLGALVVVGLAGGVAYRRRKNR